MLEVVLGHDNVFEDLGFEAEEATNLKVRTDLMLSLRSYIQSQGWSQQETTRLLGETQTRIESLISGDIGQFTVDELIGLFGKVGMEVKVEVVVSRAA